MSRIGKKEIGLPKDVVVSVEGRNVTIKGPKGQLEREIHPEMQVTIDEGFLRVVPTKNSQDLKKFHGLTRSLLNNMVIGVSTGFSKSLKLIGVGYRAALKGDEINLTLGYSHPVVHKLPKGLTAKIDKQTVIELSGIDKELVGQCAANIRAYRKPEPYHGKGVRYLDEVIITKAGKSAGKK